MQAKPLMICTTWREMKARNEKLIEERGQRAGRSPVTLHRVPHWLKVWYSPQSQTNDESWHWPPRRNWKPVLIFWASLWRTRDKAPPETCSASSVKQHGCEKNKSIRLTMFQTCTHRCVGHTGSQVFPHHLPVLGTIIPEMFVSEKENIWAAFFLSCCWCSSAQVKVHSSQKITTGWSSEAGGSDSGWSLVWGI